MKMKNNSMEPKRSYSGGIWKTLWLGFACLFLACNSENAPDCFQSAGDLVKETVSVASFDKITVFGNVQLVMEQGETQSVTIETGKNLRNEVTAEVTDGRLVLRNTNDCNYVRKYGLTKIYVTAPNLTEVRSSTGWPITSVGTLAYPNIFLVSESYSDPEAETTDGSFDLQLDSQSVRVLANGIAYFKLGGNTENLNVQIAAGDSRVDAKELVAQKVVVDHRGTNDILIDPQQSLSGMLRGTGNLIAATQPPVVEVTIQYTGRLIFAP